MNKFLMTTGISTVGTTPLVAGEIYSEPIKEATEQIINTGDLKAPLIALVSSVIIQLVLKGINLFAKKFFPNATQAKL